jgi:hypothetical protein
MKRWKKNGKKSKYAGIYALIRFSTSSSLGRAGIAPFLVVVIAPHAFANLSTSLNFDSSCNYENKSIINYKNSNGAL